jgi:hypothetical protein
VRVINILPACRSDQQFTYFSEKRIPPQAEIQYELELVGLPGKEGELFEALQES